MPLVGSDAMSVMVLHVPPEAPSTSREDPVADWPLIQKLTLVGPESAGVWTRSPVASSFREGDASP